MTSVWLAVGSFAGMEAISYAAHRWVMHGFAMAWHRSHHVPPRSRFERNDLFPLCFSVIGVLLFALPALGWVPEMLWVGVGVASYGVAYLFVHEVYIHQRVPVTVPRFLYLEWLRESHRLHHRNGGEPYGMLLPIMAKSKREVGAPAPEQPQRRDLLERSPVSGGQVR